MPKKTNKVYACSFDADNCLFSKKYNPSNEEIRSGNCQQIITSNKHLLNALKDTTRKNIQHAYVFVGSLRQSKYLDVLNSIDNQTESFFIAIKKVADYLGFILDKFLIEDIYTNRPSGNSFDIAINQRLAVAVNSCPADHSKLSILYAQIHKIAGQYPCSSIFFNFFDDRGLGTFTTMDILDYLYIFFNDNKELLPKNVTLCLTHYAGYNVTPYMLLQGTGFIDSNYRETAKNIINKTKGKMEKLKNICANTLPSRREKKFLAHHYLGSLFNEIGLHGIGDDDIESMPDATVESKQNSEPHIKNQVPLPPPSYPPIF